MSRPADPTGASSGRQDDDASLDLLLGRLGGEIGRPLDLLREGIGRLLDDTSRPISDAERDQARVMLGLCDDLGRLTRECFEGGKPADA